MTRDELITDMMAALRMCLTAEQERRKKLKAGAPATTYTERRIASLQAVLNTAIEMGYGPGQ